MRGLKAVATATLLSGLVGAQYRWRTPPGQRQLLAGFWQVGSVPRPVFDEARGRWVQLFKRGGNLPLGTEEFDGHHRWVTNPKQSPPAREDFATAYDPQRKRVVVFGGYETSSVSWPTDTWSWDGASWTRSTVPGPPARFNPKMAYDPNTKTILLVGGQGAKSTKELDDTWSWDGASWKQLAPKTRPSGVGWAFGLAVDRRRKRLVLYTRRMQTYEWDGTDWTLKGDPRTPGVVAPVVAWSARGVLLHGGLRNSIRTNDTWRWDGRTWQPLQPQHRPPKDSWSIMVSDPIRPRILLVFPGHRGTLWEWNGSDWNNAGPSDAAPGERLVYDRRRRVVVGFDVGSILEWDGQHMRDARPRPNPGLRFDVGLAFDAARGYTILFGGRSWGRAVGDTWAWDGKTWIQLGTVSIVSPRWDHDLAFDAARGVVLLHGGIDRTTKFRDTFTWDGKRWLRVARNGPLTPNRIAYDPVRKRVVLMREGHATRPWETWEWDGKRWLQQHPAKSPAGDGKLFDACFHPEEGGVVVAIGRFLAGHELWSYDGKTWRLLHLEPSKPFPFPTALAYDGSRRRLVARQTVAGFGAGGMGEFVPDRLRIQASTVQLPGRLEERLWFPSDPHRVFLVLLSGQTAPGIPFRIRPRFGLETIPLAADGWLALSLSLGLFGVTDGQGRATMSLPFPHVPVLVGLRGYTAAVTLDAAGIRTVSAEEYFSLRG